MELVYGYQFEPQLRDRVSCSLGWPQPHYGAEGIFELLIFQFLPFEAWIIGLCHMPSL